MSDIPDRLSGAITEYSRVLIVLLLLVSTAIGMGAGQVDQSSSLDQFQSETAEGRALEYAEANFSTGAENTTAVQVIVRGENVLSRDALIEELEFQRALRAEDQINATLVEERPIVGVANFVAITAIRTEQIGELQRRAASLNETANSLNATAGLLTATLDRARTLQRQFDRLNRSLENGTISQSEYEPRAEALRRNISLAQEQAADSITAFDSLSEAEAQEYITLFEQIRTLQSELDALNQSRKNGEISPEEYQERAAEIGTEIEQTYRGVQAVLLPAYSQLQQRADDLAADRRALQNATQSRSMPPLSDQIDQLESMNASQVEQILDRLLAGEGQGAGIYAFLPTGFEPESGDASATMIIVRQVSPGSTAGGAAPDSIIDSQLAIDRVANAELGEETLVFGAGIITDEINRSMADSLALVGPLALLFVLVVLIIAYRDPLDIILGLVGIGLVLLWTFGFMGWMDIDFNQLFVAVPVLLIGLSIDYAIHVFMRHREERDRGEGAGVERSMQIALASVGVALTYVTATTVIGFLSNLISSVPPIREFGVVSSVGIVAALVVFGILIPAIKVEVDGALERRGWDRQKRAFGTGGGRLGSVLSIGGIAARRAPWVVVLVTLLLTAGGAWGATNVDTSFNQADFIADDPPEWMDRLPDQIQPGEYSAKRSLTFVNDNFVREDTQAQLLIRGDVTDPAVLDRIATAEDRAAESDVTVTLSNGEADLQSPLRAIQRVAERNETFAAVLAESDTDGDGVPDRSVTTVYDALFKAEPDTARNVLYRTEDGTYAAVRVVVSVQGNADGDAVLSDMRDIASQADEAGVSVIATGRPIVFELVSEDLLSTVIESLLITLVAVFLFLMVTYRFTHGSATLGVVTLLPVAFSVSWILGTMFLLGIPFNVLTGLITSLTIGLGVAYSIHLSERYGYELRRSGDRWGAMRRALTGTGGALLGSAATTVGGFGVLVFAILPPLRQFGIITGLTIIYAFLGSVLVLPTFLALWTRYLGPDIADSDGSAAELTRAVNRTTVEPGGRYEVSISLLPDDGRTVLRESPPGGQIKLLDVAPNPVDVLTAGGTIHAAWERSDREPITLRYAASVPDGTPDGSELEFTGTVRTGRVEETVSGVGQIRVVRNVFERISAQDHVTRSDLRAAGEALQDGRITEAEFEAIYEMWLDQDDTPGSEDGGGG